MLVHLIVLLVAAGIFLYADHKKSECRDITEVVLLRVLMALSFVLFCMGFFGLIISEVK